MNVKGKQRKQNEDLRIVLAGADMAADGEGVSTAAQEESVGCGESRFGCAESGDGITGPVNSHVAQEENDGKGICGRSILCL
jgi:hypothetical protein